MFDLDREVKQWCREQWGFFGLSTRRSLELEDHLQCEVETLRLQGFDVQEALKQAKQKIGNARLLRKEFSKVTREALFCRRNVACSVAILILIGIFLGDFDWVQRCGSRVLALVMMLTWSIH